MNQDIGRWNTQDIPGKILVIDDDPRNRKLVEKYLSMIGYQVFQAEDGFSGLMAARQYKPDLILLDIIMPGMNGFQVCQTLRGDPETANIPIVIVTALYETEQRIAALESGADDFLTKPFSIYELGARVKSLLRIKHQHDELERRNRLFYQVMTRYMAPEVSEQILQNPDRYLKLGGETRLITTMFADIRGFTGLAQKRSADRVVELLNTIFKEMVDVILKWRGTFDKFLGDAVMAVYGAPVSYQDDTLRAARTALEMQQAFQALRATWNDPDEQALGLGIGINTGEAVIGNIGTEHLMNYTAIGDAVNIAQRLEELAQGGQILITQATLDRIHTRARARLVETCLLRGRQEPTTIYLLDDML